MADLSKITTPDGSSYNLKDSSARLSLSKISGVYIVKGTQTTNTSSWTGNLQLNSLFDGLTIAFYLPRSSGVGNVTLNLTLADGTTKTGAIDVYLSGSERVTSQFEAGSMMTMTYWSGNSISVDGTSVSTARWIVHSSGGMLWGELDS